MGLFVFNFIEHISVFTQQIRSNLGESRGLGSLAPLPLSSPPRFRVGDEMNSIKYVINSMTLTSYELLLSLIMEKSHTALAVS